MDHPSSSQGEPVRQPGSAGWLERIGLLGIALALLVSGYLAWRALSHASIPGCGPGAGCGEVLSSKWSTAFGLPVALFGGLTYLCVLVVALTNRKRERTFALTIGGALVLGGALWFMIVQGVILKKWCPWCCSAHVCAIIGTICLLLARRALTMQALRSPALLWGFVMVLGLALVQSLAPTRDHMVSKQSNGMVTTASGEAADTLSLHGGEFPIDLTAFPVMGTLDAEVRWVVISDFTCPHCQDLHRSLHDVTSSSDEKLAVVVLPGYRDEEAEAIHRAMLTLWHSDPVLYQEVSAIINQGAISVNARSIRELIATRITTSLEQLEAAHRSKVEAQLEVAQGVMNANDEFLEVASLPQLMIGNRVLAGQLTTATLKDLLRDGASATKPGVVASTVEPRGDSSPPEKEEMPSTGKELVTHHGKPGIEFETTHLVTPEVVAGESAYGTYKFTNTGDAPLTIENLKTSCGCTKVEGWEQTVAPGDSGSFKIKVDSKRFTGKVVKSIIVTSNAANVPNGVSRLKVELNVYSPVRVYTNIVTFGNVLMGTPTPSKSIRITVTDGPIEFGTPTVTAPEFAVSVNPIEATKVYNLDVAIPKPKLGSFGGSIIIPVKHARIKELRYPVYANIVEPVVIQPKKMGVGKGVLQTPTRRSIILTCHDKTHRGFEVLDVQYSGDADVEIIENKAYRSASKRYQVTIPAGFDAGAAIANKERIIIRTSHPDYPKFELPFE